MATLVITAVIPRIIRILRMLLPTILPIVIPALLLSAAVMLTAASGILVPIATIVSPITSCGIPSFLAIPAAPSFAGRDTCPAAWLDRPRPKPPWFRCSCLPARPRHCARSSSRHRRHQHCSNYRRKPWHSNAGP